MSEAEEMRVTGDDQETAMREYREAGEARARALGNRGPIRFSADGSLHDDILAAYWQHGFYIFESVITQNELADIERDVQEIIERAPTEPGGVVDRHGRAALERRHGRRRPGQRREELAQLFPKLAQVNFVETLIATMRTRIPRSGSRVVAKTEIASPPPSCCTCFCHIYSLYRDRGRPQGITYTG